MKNYKIVLEVAFVLSLLVLVLLIFLFRFSNKTDAGNLDEFAQCLSGKNVVMYGAYWCPHCQNEKAAFGDSFGFVDYVECTARPNDCIAAGIKGYPTWIFSDGRRLEGEQGIEKLSKESGCALPQKLNN